MSTNAVDRTSEPGGRPIFVILPGVTATRERLRTLERNAQTFWPEARVEVPNYLSRRRGVRDVGAWLDRWCATELTSAGDVFVFAFILGAAALPYAPGLSGRTRRLVILRSRFQEAVPRALEHRFGYLLTALLFGRAVADMGRGPLLPKGFSPSCPVLTLLETRPTRLAERLHLQPLGDSDLGLTGALEMDIDHDRAYDSPALLTSVVEFLKGDQGPIENGKALGTSQ
jgi:hypothetical protein